MKFDGWQRLNAEYAKQFGVEAPGWPPNAPKQLKREEEAMESTLQKPAFVAAKTTPKATTIVYWIVTALFCLQMSFTAYAQLRLPQVARGVHSSRLPRLFPGGALVGQAPRRGAAACAGAGAAQGVGLRRLRHQPRLGAHRPSRGGRWPGGVGLGGGTGVLWALSYFFWRRLQAAPAHA